MRAAILRETGKPLEIGALPDPSPGPGELVVRVASCGICGSDLHVACLPGGLPPGAVMGHEFAGEVVEVGPLDAAVAGPAAAAPLRPGDRVCALPFIGCGRCGACLAGDGIRCPTLRTLGFGDVPGAFAEYARVGVGEAVRLPDAVSFAQGALVEPLAVGLHAVERARLAPGADVLVVGAGPIGLAVALWARFLGARHVVVSERAPDRRALADRFGATGTVDPAADDVATAFADLAGAAPDTVFECVGVKGLLQECLGLAAPRASVVVVGVCMEPDTLVPALGVAKELSLYFVVAYRRRDFELTLALLEQGRIPSTEMITDVVGLDDFPGAFEALKQPTTQCKVMLEP